MFKLAHSFCRVVAFALLVSLFAIGVQGQNSYTSDMYTFPVIGPSGIMTVEPMLVPGAEARLQTRPGGALMTIHAAGLTPGDVVTSWWVVFNHPENCSDGVCGEDDVLPFPGNREAGLSLLYGDGALVGDGGTAFYLDALDTGDTEGVVFGDGLTNPLGAEIHFVLRTHGPAQTGKIKEMRSSMNGGCDPDPPYAPCEDIQFAVFQQG